MRKILLALVVAFISVPAQAGYKVTFPDKLRLDAVGAYDFNNKDPLGGMEADALWFRRPEEDKPILYLAVNHLYNAGEKWRGSLGGALGINTGKLGEITLKIADLIAPDHTKRLKWFQTITDYTTIEVMGGYRFFGRAPDDKPWVYGISGKLRIPLEKFFYLWQKKANE